jgi:hypothetical protein
MCGYAHVGGPPASGLPSSLEAWLLQSLRWVASTNPSFADNPALNAGTSAGGQFLLDKLGVLSWNRNMQCKVSNCLAMAFGCRASQELTAWESFDPQLNVDGNMIPGMGPYGLQASCA